MLYRVAGEVAEALHWRPLVARELVQVDVLVLRDDPVRLLRVGRVLLDLALSRAVLHWLLLLFAQIALQGADLAPKFFEFCSLLILCLFVQH